MYNKKMYKLGSNRSVIRELFEYGKIMAKEQGEDKVFDFSLGNPSVPAPEEVRKALEELVSFPDTVKIHGYTSAQGDLSVRKAISDNINRRFGVKMTPDLIYMTVGAAASLSITLRALNEDKDEFIVFAPFFPEYRVFIENAEGVPVVIPAGKNMSLDLVSFEKALTKNTKGVIINSPNNPSGAVYSEEQIKTLCDILRSKSKEYGHPIFLISDEPYREIAYDGVFVPYLMNYYDDTVVCYSYSKSLSLPGERIGYIAVSPKCTESGGLYAAICGAGRSLGYVCAPALFQRVAAKCVDCVGDIAAYKKNRDLLTKGLQEYGYEFVTPSGAFYLFVKALEEDANAFSERAKKLGLLLVPSDTFGVKGYVRISYCVSYDLIERSMPLFKRLAESYKK
ncbi:MAG: pyridoxal phosphate-dependent aminotransferase [Clostridia bacterium]|nr:pyridoxal phosphate-dependent aminotransferase [Clostridia bacterium]